MALIEAHYYTIGMFFFYKNIFVYRLVLVAKIEYLSLIIKLLLINNKLGQNISNNIKTQQVYSY